MLDSFQIELSGVPIYLQIRDQMLQAIGAGLAKPGERMPTMRQVAIALRVDLNTVKHAYDALARTGAVEVQPARGTFVAEHPPPLDLAMQKARVNDLAHRAIASAKTIGADPLQVARRIIEINAESGGQE
ncbi:GntR family transcriptional regulator [Acidisphaera sp. L21]|uniref:GntR family transcriptional regulator n=1 Tax=Acidisphaera sp. L21 TaxID=1641851 RepID=UPI00131E49F0|nr:GntR family transcriptional regulator [Acidisphaera sp. L21]